MEDISYSRTELIEEVVFFLVMKQIIQLSKI